MWVAGHKPCGNLSSLPVTLKREKYFLDDFRPHWNNKYFCHAFFNKNNYKNINIDNLEYSRPMM